MAEQEADPHSILNWHRALIALRRANPELVYGDIEFLQPSWKDYFGYVRGGTFLVEMNLAGVEGPRPLFRGRTELLLGARSGERMAPWEASVSRILG